MKADARALGLVMLAILATSCAAPITHPVELRDRGTAEAGRFAGVSVGLQPAVDRRGEADPGLVGYRQLRRGRERYATISMDLAEALTRAISDRLGRMGARVSPAAGWDLTPDAMPTAQSDADHLVACEVIRFLCRAEKKALGTRLQMDLELVFYLGDRKDGRVVRRPVQVQIERFEAVFSPQKVEGLVNEALAEALDRGFQNLG